jgi:hypothetical protein
MESAKTNTVADSGETKADGNFGTKVGTIQDIKNVKKGERGISGTKAPPDPTYDKD